MKIKHLFPTFFGDLKITISKQEISLPPPVLREKFKIGILHQVNFYPPFEMIRLALTNSYTLLTIQTMAQSLSQLEASRLLEYMMKSNGKK
jgi:hypothetical protein